MPEPTTFLLFLSAAFVLAMTPGPGIFYVLARSLKGGRQEGFVSALGTAVGGLMHVVLAAVGLSTVLATSAVAFGVVKYAGAAYLIYLGLRTLVKKEAHEGVETAVFPSMKPRAIFAQGVVTEALNPKTALFFLAFIPQFINPAGVIVWQFLLLGSISVLLNTSADVTVATLAGPINGRLRRSPRLQTGQRLFSGMALIALGAYVAVAGERQAR